LAIIQDGLGDSISTGIHSFLELDDSAHIESQDREVIDECDSTSMGRSGLDDVSLVEYITHSQWTTWTRTDWAFQSIGSFGPVTDEEEIFGSTDSPAISIYTYEYPSY
jgi:hypothetical protein